MDSEKKTEHDLGADAAEVDGGMATSAESATARHTKGRWHVVDGHDTDFDIKCVDADGDEFWICQTICGLPHGEERANAHLIAAAPEMLEIARIVNSASMSGTKGNDESWIGWQWSQGGAKTAHRLRDLARAAIAKAEGKAVGSHGNPVSMEPAPSTPSAAQK